MHLLQISMVLGLAICLVHNVHSMDFDLMNFARDTVMEYSSGTERTVNILQPQLKVVNPPVNPYKRRNKKKSRRRRPVDGHGGVVGAGGGGGGFLSMRKHRRKFRFRRPPSGYRRNRKPQTKLTFITRTKTYRRRSKPSNKFLEAMATIERAVAEAEVARSRIRYSDQKLQDMKKTIKLAVQKRMFQFARHRLGQALFLIKNHNSTPTSRSRRSTQNQASVFMDDLKQTMGPAQFDKFMAVMGDVTLMFAIDTTGSMADEIDTAKRIAVDVINYQRENPVSYILSPFNDPTTGPVTFRETTEGALFVDAINKLKATGGGDCPELTMKGILDALYEGPDPGSPMYVFTDASAKDATPENINEVKIMAKFLGKVVINFFTTALCRGSSVTDSPFMQIAEATSGQMLSLTSATELQNLNGFTGSVLGGSTIINSGCNIFNRKKRAALTASRYSIKIDDSIGNMSICVTTDRPNQGAAISLTDSQGVTITSGKVSMSKVSIYEIASPRVGTWTLVIPPSAGMHNYFVKSNSDQNIDFDYYFLMLIKKPASEVPVTDPLIGENSKVVITLAGNEKTRKNSVVLELITKYGKHIRDLQLTPDSRGVRYTATFTPPSRPFKLKIKGTTKRGNPFERISRSIVEPKHVQLRVLHSANDFTLRRGTSSTVTFHLYNSANVNKRVKINVKDRLGYARINGLKVRTIRRGRWAFFSVLFRTPMSAAIGTCDTAFISVSVNNGAEIVSQPVQLIVIK
ncbi:von Willebrand factor A domain-containing protein 7-like isoform X4 [Actinia tenebrosa]|uniref:von Willebrand factor A domain-containing protein 7-like isoform X3 n=1 Tax=Actinia tenebrosa TaxID=6105 RepID=A0A6P8IP72_ACTTE|nr:von Willebrand factor A domain-containing protein 7-like isoform X3 [Actinia tenebrosa]XP_031568685.1 von Willebrand factor A domain-containing protein 7-like isoform X4 [Actinia tenebrosa]